MAMAPLRISVKRPDPPSAWRMSGGFAESPEIDQPFRGRLRGGLADAASL